ncbi:MAG: MmcQ/YjbR family DNA-binding protein [Lapillicoccus sp.]
MPARKARPADLEELAGALPEVERSASYGEMPAFAVRGKTFVVYRGPRKDAIDEHGERLPDVIMIAVPGPEEKEALLASGAPWFTTSHFDGYNAVLVREAHLGQLTRQELAEVVEDAWLAKAPKRLAKEWLERDGGTAAERVRR